MTNLDELWTAEEAAEQVGVTAAAIYTWVRRGALASAGKRGRYKLFRLDDVFACEAGRKRKHRRKLQGLGAFAACAWMPDLGRLILEYYLLM